MARAHAALRPGGWILSPSVADGADDSSRRIWAMIMEPGAVTDSSFVMRAFAAAGFETPRVLQTPSPMRPIAAQR